jgi:DNA-binding SARP family transcriptional activator
MPRLDHTGKRQYYCLWCGRIFAVTTTEKQAAGGIVHLPWAGPAPRYRLWTLGTFRLERRGRGGGQLWQTLMDTAPEQQHTRALLQCLVSCPGRKLSREHARELLWPDMKSSAAASRLDQAVGALQRLVEPRRGRTDRVPVFVSDQQVLQIADQELLWVDADAFDVLLDQARTTLESEQRELFLEEALLFYRGDYLQGEDGIDWVRVRREALLRGWIGLLLELADLRITRASLPAAADLLDRLLAVDPTNEAAVQRLIRLLAHLGRGTEARAMYERFTSTLSSEYHLVPLPETRALYASCVLES